MKIAIHHRKGSFSERWIDYCNQNNINYVLVNAFDNNFIQEVISCDAFLWHFSHGDIKDFNKLDKNETTRLDDLLVVKTSKKSILLSKI